MRPTPEVIIEKSTSPDGPWHRYSFSIYDPETQGELDGGYYDDIARTEQSRHNIYFNINARLRKAQREAM